MRLQEIQCRAFRSFVGQAINVDADRVIIGGVNASGKSTLREAVRFALTGSVKDADNNDLPGELLAPSFLGVSEAAASVVVDGIGRVERQWRPGTYTLNAHGITGTSTVQQQALYDKLSTTEAMLQAVIDSRNFLRLHHAKGKALIMGLLDVRVVIDEEGNGREYTLDELDAAYKDAFEQRKLAKLKQKGFALPPVPGPPETKMTLPRIEERLQECRQELDDALKVVGETSGMRAILRGRRRYCLDILHTTPKADPVYIAGLRNQIDELEERLGIMEAEPVTPRPAQDEDLSASGRLHILRNRAEALAKHHPDKGCVLDPEVPCETAKVRFTRAAKVVQAEIDAAPLLVSRAPAIPLPSPMTDLRRQLDEFKRILAAHDRSQEDYERVTTELTEVDAKLSALPDTTEAEQDVEELRAKVAKGETLLRVSKDHQKAVGAYDKALQAQQALQADVDRLEARCALLGPTGARVAALAEKLGAFEEQVNVVTSAFGWTFKVQVEPWQVMANDRPVQSYSWSEQYRIGIALQLAIAKLSGLDFAIVDELDLLDAANRKILFQMLYNADLGQIVILATREPDVALPTQKNGSPLPNTLCYRLGIQEHRSVILEKVS